VNKFDSIFEEFDKEQKVAIITHVNPDPDAIGSAVGTQWLLKKKFGISSDVFYGGTIDSPENKTMVNVLSLSLKTLEEYDSEKYSKIIVVDCTEQNVGVKEIDVDIIIDHHRTAPQKDEKEYDLVDIKPVGSCCTLIYDLIEKTGLSFDKESTDNDDIVATAMLLGIRTDTNDLLVNAVDLDHHAHQALAKVADSKKITDIKNYPLPKWVLELKKEASKHEELIGSVYVTFVGVISSVKRSGLYMVADEMKRYDFITTALVYGIIDGEIQISVRSKDISLDVDAFCKKILGKGKAGGKLGIGGGQLDLGFFSQYPQSVKDNFIEVTKAIMIDKVSKHFTGEASEAAGD
jgi:nanoRNase/pAp phosphatase (c-di-AMP/oligoRNAs hydrolase)